MEEALFAMWMEYKEMNPVHGMGCSKEEVY